MSILKRGFLHIQKFKQGDRLNYSFEVLGYDLSGKELAMDIKVNETSRPLVRFSSEHDPPTITTSYNSTDDLWVVTLSQTSLDMKVLTKGSYVFDLEAYTTDEDTETIVDGIIEVVPEITKRDK